MLDMFVVWEIIQVYSFLNNEIVGWGGVAVALSIQLLGVVYIRLLGLGPHKFKSLIGPKWEGWSIWVYTSVIWSLSRTKQMALHD